MFIYEELGSLGGNDSYALGLNDQGQVVGKSTLANGETHAFLYSNATMTDLGTLGGKESSANLINNGGQIAGISTEAGESSQSAFQVVGGVMKRLALNVSTTDGSVLAMTGMNDNGEIVGYTKKPSAGKVLSRSFRVQGDALKVLPAEFPMAVDIANNGKILGVQTGQAGPRVAIYYRGQITVPAGLKNIAATPNAMNERGQIVGVLKAGSMPFIFSNGQVTTPVQDLPGSMIGINDIGIALGRFFRYGKSVAFASDRLGWSGSQFYPSLINEMTAAALAPIAMNFLEVTGINNRYQVCGYGRRPDGTIRGFLLTPMPSVIVSGPNRRETSSSRITLHGWAFGNVTQVVCSRNYGRFQPVSGLESWTVKVPLKKGRNQIVIAVDGTYGRYTATVRIFRK